MAALIHELYELKEDRLDTNLLPDDDALYEKASIALHMIAIILADLPLRWQLAIVKALGARIVIVGELQQRQPPERPTSSV